MGYGIHDYGMVKVKQVGRDCLVPRRWEGCDGMDRLICLLTFPKDCALLEYKVHGGRTPRNWSFQHCLPGGLLAICDMVS